MPRFDLDSYDTVESRLVRFWHDHAGGRVETSLLSNPNDPKQFVFRAEVYFDAADPHPRGVGHAQETAGGSGANALCACENGETSAIGRALANCGYSGDKRPSRTEMEKAGREPNPPARAAGLDPQGRDFPKPQQAAVTREYGEIKQYDKTSNRRISGDPRDEGALLAVKPTFETPGHGS